MSALELRDVVKRYDSGSETVNAIDGVSLSIGSGEFVALYGPSGSGKTTLLMMAATIKSPDSGSIVFDGREVGRLDKRESARFRRETVGIVFQSFHLMQGASALDNAALKLFALNMRLDEARDTARPWLERLGLGRRLEHRPSELSMGERQRVAIARALANKPRMLLADEPTGNLDSRRSREVLGLLGEISVEQQIPVMLVTHDPQATGFVNQVYTLRDGTLSEGLDLDLHATVSG
ncbi:MAG TPA: ABC transporter ATP-binding protein [Solirubrobacteraceae bacterium]|jgi:putative ABC transport system ATP-binding protein|nr:ABC transporter ATP-binding protein [Solirubrobacteraceae bacterium]